VLVAAERKKPNRVLDRELPKTLNKKNSAGSSRKENSNDANGGRWKEQVAVGHFLQNDNTMYTKL